MRTKLVEPTLQSFFKKQSKNLQLMCESKHTALKPIFSFQPVYVLSQIPSSFQQTTEAYTVFVSAAAHPHTCVVHGGVKSKVLLHSVIFFFFHSTTLHKDFCIICIFGHACLLKSVQIDMISLNQVRCPQLQPTRLNPLYKPLYIYYILYILVYRV